jgi:predicted DNA-binding protein
VSSGEVNVARKVGKTKLRSIRVPDPQWDRWEQAANTRGQTVSDYLRELADREADKRLGRRRD